MIKIKNGAILLFACCSFCIMPSYCEHENTESVSRTEKVTKAIKESADKVKSVLNKAKKDVVKGFEKGKEKIMSIKSHELSTKKANGFTPDDFKFEEFQHIDISKCEKPDVVEVKSNFEKPIWFVKTEGSTICLNIKFKNEGHRSFYKQPCLQSILLECLTDDVGSYGQGGFERMLKDNAISMNVFKTDDDIVISISCLKEHYNLALSMLIELLTKSNISESTIERKKFEYINELKQAKVDPKRMATEKLSNLISVPEYEYRTDYSIKMVPTYTRDDAIKCYKTLFDPRNAEITVVGNVSTEHLTSELNKVFDAIKDRHNDFKSVEQKTELKTTQSKYDHMELDNPNTTIAFALPGVSLTDEDRFAIYTVNRIWGWWGGLSSRLFRDIREKQHLVYAIGTSIINEDLQTYLSGRANTSPQYVKAVITGIMKQLQELHDKGITEKELSNDKLRVVASHVLDSPDTMLSYVVGRRDDGATVSTINEHLVKYSKLTVEDVNRALKKVFDPSKLVVVSVGKTVEQVSKAEPDSPQKPIQDESSLKKAKSDEQIQKVDTAPSSETEKSKTSLPIKEAVLENGLRVVVCNMPASKDAIYFGIGYLVGAADDPRDIVGASHFLEHMAFKESTNMPAGKMDHFLSTFNKYTNAFTCDDITFYTQHCNKAFLDADLRMESERMSNAKFLDDTVAKETNVILAEREMRYEANPYTKYIFELIRKNFYIYSTYSYETIGYQDQIKACKPNRLEEHYKKYYVPNNAVALFVGDISLEEAVDACKRNFGHIKRGAEVKRNRVIDPSDMDVSSELTYRNPQIKQKKLGVIYKIPRKNYETVKQELTISMINDMLFVGDSSIVSDKLCNKLELAYGISGAVYDRPYDSVPWWIDMTLKTKDVDFEELKTKFYNTINDFLELKARTSIEEKFEKTKKSFKLRFERMMDNPDEMNWFLINELLINERPINDVRDIIDIVNSITFDEFINTAKDLLSDKRRVVVVKYEPSNQ